MFRAVHCNQGSQDQILPLFDPDKAKIIFPGNCGVSGDKLVIRPVGSLSFGKNIKGILEIVIQRAKGNGALSIQFIQNDLLFSFKFF